MRRRPGAIERWAAASGLAASGAACADAPLDPAGSGSAGEASSGSASATALAESSGPSGPGAAPEVIDIGQDVLVLREGQSVVLTAVVVDPDDDVVSGSLHGPGTPDLYGAFTPHPSGRWRAEVSWSAVNERWPLSFTAELALPLWVRFVDAEGHEASAHTTVRAVCGGLSDTACDGECVDVQVDDEHCDGCGQACVIGPDLVGAPRSGGCDGSACQPWWSDCVRAGPAEGPPTCAEHCAALERRCVDDGCDALLGPGSVMAYADHDECMQGLAAPAAARACAEPLGERRGPTTVRCCCG
ncbi:MAG: hypothetical protein KDK70_01245 [Myxococcales bacterium]|nr:hypothetical protein [Myxococcales bacterium]